MLSIEVIFKFVIFQPVQKMTVWLCWFWIWFWKGHQCV